MLWEGVENTHEVRRCLLIIPWVVPTRGNEHLHSGSCGSWSAVPVGASSPSPPAPLPPSSVSPSPSAALHLWPGAPPLGESLVGVVSPRTTLYTQCCIPATPRGSSWPHLPSREPGAHLGEDAPPLPVPQLQVRGTVALQHLQSTQLLLLLGEGPEEGEGKLVQETLFVFLSCLLTTTFTSPSSGG